MSFKTLVIAPRHPDLLMADDEVMQVVNTLGAKLLTGAQATIHGLLGILREGWDIVWLVTHANEQGWFLSDGLVSASEMTTMVRSCGAMLTVMNTCSSYEVAHAIHRELGTAFVCTVKEVPDRTAFITGTVFAQKIAAGLDFQTAFEAAKPGQNSTYTFLAAKGQLMPPAYENRPRTNIEELGQLAELIRRLDVIVNGSSQWNVNGLVPTVKDLEQKLDNLTVEVAKLQANQIVNRRFVIALCILCGLLILAVAGLLYMQGGGG